MGTLGSLWLPGFLLLSCNFWGIKKAALAGRPCFYSLILLEQFWGNYLAKFREIFFFILQLVARIRGVLGA
jgi:hypothetical protein